MNPLVYFSSSSENTHRFVGRTGLPAIRIPIDRQPEKLRVDTPYILVVPSYGGGSSKGAVPTQVIRFLNDEHNRSLIRGVIAAGNTNFGAAYCIAGEIISHCAKKQRCSRLVSYYTCGILSCCSSISELIYGGRGFLG